MKDKLIEFWKTKVPLHLNPPKTTFKSLGGCDNSQVTPFDLVKDKFSELLNIDESRKLTSVDVIKLNREQDLCLIEVKLINLEAEAHENGIKPIEVLEKRIREAIAKFSDSVSLLISIMGYYKMPIELYKVVLSPKPLKIIPYVLISCNNRQLETFKVAIKHILNIKLSARIQNPIKLINCYEYDQIFN